MRKYFNETWRGAVGTAPIQGPDHEALPYMAAAKLLELTGQHFWPLLYFHGGPGCHVLLEDPVIEGVTLPHTPNHARPVSNSRLNLANPVSAGLHGGGACLLPVFV